MKTRFGQLADFRTAEDGVVTVDWLVLLAALTVAGMVVLDIGTGAMSGHNDTIHSELQDSEFESAWDDYVPVQPPDDPDDDTEDFAGWIPTEPGNGGGTGTGGGGGGTGTGGTGGTGGGGTGDPGTGGGGTGGTGGGGTGGTGGGTGGGTTDPDPVTPYIPTSPVVGCPSTDYLGEAYTTTGEDLEDETVRLDASGGGQTPLDSCPGIPGTGYVYANPTFSLYLSEMDDFERFVVRIHSDCDTTLLLRDAQGNYHFDDDSGPDLNGRLRLRDMEPLNGRVDIYVGTFDGDTCNDVQVRLILRD